MKQLKGETIKTIEKDASTFTNNLLELQSLPYHPSKH